MAPVPGDPATQSPLRTSAKSAALLIASFLFVQPFPVLAQTAVSAKGATPTAAAPARASVEIPRVDRAPTLEDFLDMKPANGMAEKLRRVSEFVQRDPKDGEPATQRTEVYLGYDDKNLYAVFLAFDTEPKQVRARMTRRENMWDDDLVQIILDTFHDQRRAYFFFCNPLGIQADGIHTEGQGGDVSFDTLWKSEGKLTSQGYVVRMAIPFRSLRFHPAQGNWGVILERRIPRLSERHFWPRVSSRVSGLLNQGGTLKGLQKISPGRNLQFIPYGLFRSFRALDQRDPAAPMFRNKTEVDGGLDAKVVLKDRLVLDFTLNPDFNQVESDQPQVTVNQRFEVFFPEKRPFFLENQNFFETPVTLLFTRRIADPQFGVRATGKLGRYAVGALFADDQSPGRAVPKGDPLEGTRAYFSVFRVNRDVGKDSSIGVIYASREYRNSYNRTVGIDTRFKFGKNWSGSAQAVTSSTRNLDGTTQAGPAYELHLSRSSRKLHFNTLYIDTSPGFLTQTGFFRRPDVRRFSNFFRYQFRPEGKRLISHGMGIFQLALWARDQARLEEFYNINYFFSFERQTEFGAFGNTGHELLRPRNFSTLTADRDYATGHRGFWFYSGFFKQVTFFTETGWGRGINFGPANGPPVPARSNFVAAELTVRPFSRLSIEHRYLLTRLRALGAGASIFNNHLIRQKWNYQINRELSLRFILDYNATLANRQFSSLQTTKNFNVDFLVSYLVHPGTALYVGYNSNRQNLDPSLTQTADGLLRTRSRLINDGRQFFVKASYLFLF